MTEEKGNSNLIVLGIATLAAMFFAYLIYQSSKDKTQQLPSPDILKSTQLQEQLNEIQKIQLQQATKIIEFENAKCATETTIQQPIAPIPQQPETPPTQDEFDSGMLSEVSMSQHQKIPSNVTRENEEIIAHRYFGMA